MKYANSVLDLIGNTPLVRLNSVARDYAPTDPREGRIPEPGRLVQRPHRRADHRRSRSRGQAETGRHDRRTDERQHRHRARARRPAARVPLRLRAARQGGRGEAQRAQGVRRRGRRDPDLCRPRQPRVVLLGERPAGARDSGRVQARPVLQPQRPAEPLRDDGSRDLARHRGQGHPLRRGSRHRRHDLGRRKVPQRGVGRPGADHRRRPGGLASTPAEPVVPTSSRASAKTSGRPPTTPRVVDRHHRILRRRVLRPDPASRARGGTAGRRIERPRRVRRAQACGRTSTRTPSSSCCSPTAAAATSARSSTSSGCSPTDSRRSRMSARCSTSSARRAATCPTSCTRIRRTPCATPSRSWRSTTCRSCRC